jgi:hypothetical protein
LVRTWAFMSVSSVGMGIALAFAQKVSNHRARQRNMEKSDIYLLSARRPPFGR